MATFVPLRRAVLFIAVFFATLIFIKVQELTVLSTNLDSIERKDDIRFKLMIGYASGYPLRHIHRLASAFEALTSADCRIVLFSDAHPNLETQKFTKLELISPKDVLLLEDTGFHNPAFERYVVINTWLRKYSHRFSKVIMTDARDIALFGDPFSQIEYDFEGVQSFTEVVTYEYDHWYNQVWVRDCYGQEFLDEIISEKVTCCGVIVGSIKGVLSYLDAFVLELRSKGVCHGAGTDTAIHVWIIHKILYDSIIVDSTRAVITHAPKWGHNASLQLTLDSRFDSLGRLLNEIGQPYALIHQADRFPQIWDPYCAQYTTNSSS